jgi:hypothetical protein
VPGSGGMNLGDCFFMAVPPKYNVDHLWIVISDPALNGLVVIVNVTSNQLRATSEFTLESGDHPRIQHRSFVNFPDAMSVPQDKILALNGTLVKFVDPLDQTLLNKIIETAKNSKSLSNEIRCLL